MVFLGLVVQKYGGSSVADAAAILRVARRIAAYRQAGLEVVVVVSAMGDSTDELIDLAAAVSPNPPGRELDMLLTAGERISMALLAMAISDTGHEARSFTGSQAGVITDQEHGKARIIDVTPGRIRDALDAGAIAIVAGFQGVSQTTKDVTTLGRGGSDTTAVALAAALGADVCEIYTDVDGVFTADPRVVRTAHQIPIVSHEEMLELAAAGAKVLHLRSVEYARRYQVPLHVRSSFSDRVGTLIAEAGATFPTGPNQCHTAPAEEDPMEQPIISGVAHDASEGKITLVGVPDVPGKAAAVFQIVAQAGANIDMIVQNVSTEITGRTDISFTLPTADAVRVGQALRAAQEGLGFLSLEYTDQIGKLSLVGAGMRSHPGVSARLFGALSDAGINIQMISTSEIRISVVTEKEDLERAVRAVHTAFGLDRAEGEAIVYGGSGR
ncbi:MAG: aspartate kinase [Bifidobacteriaceae bacterium]|jgi:aspartate kinase|nr:aspartate kinase [Bifidobacteriaceae bacterium]